MTTDNISSPSNNHAQSMVPQPPQKRPDRIDIGSGLLMRWSTRADAENVARFMAEAFRKRMLRGNSGVMTEYDSALVENTLAKEGENPIVACICLHASSGYYGKTPLTWGKPECVGSHPDYRSKGLVRRLFVEMIHPASDMRGDVIQIILGIPHFYCQFGYEYAVGLHPFFKLDDLPSLIPPLLESEYETLDKDGQAVKHKVTESEPFTLRKVSLNDMPYLLEMSTPEKMQRQAQIGMLYDEGYWRYTIHDLVETVESKMDCTRDTRIIVDAKTGKDCGLVMTNVGTLMNLNIFTLEDGYSYRDAMYPVLRQVIAIAGQPSIWDLKEMEAKKGSEKTVQEAKDVSQADKDDQAKDKKDNDNNKETHEPKVIQSMVLALDPQHPVSKFLVSKSKPIHKHLKLYTRIRSYADFILKVAPTLEDRIAKSAFAGITVTWHFNFFRKVPGSSGKGLEVVFVDGKIVSATDDWVPLSPQAKMLAAQERIAKAKAEKRVDKKPLQFTADFAPLSFTRLLVGNLTIEQMMELYGECSVGGGDDAQLMLEVLFPKQQYHMDMFWW
ncbi:hypothetical protein BG011_001400 [Mortierella polycephala]|uniref:N-acetyltransferase domain-containing protein n=1 Tax=Mortierella polycephala TaxID=41804 RepID=A0A9P6U5Z8_9FUNG|nr:hypothetical protein BG011_001400 [Mortierella polycephala]